MEKTAEPSICPGSILPGTNALDPSKPATHGLARCPRCGYLGGTFGGLLPAHRDPRAQED